MTTYVSDTFTGANGTLIAAHTADVGSGYTRWYTFSDVNWEIQSNTLRLKDFAGSLFDHWVWNNATLPSADYEMSIDVILSGGVSGFEVALLARGDGTDALVAYLQVIGPGSTAQITGRNSGGGSSDNALNLSVADGTHTVDFIVSGNTQTLTYDGVVVLTQTISTFSSAGTAGFSLDHSMSLNQVSLNNFLVQSYSAPPPPPPPAPPADFWTSFVGSHEVP